jgi:acyl-CoA synthetase (AMP-forming)/AMP-acid ligase II
MYIRGGYNVYPAEVEAVLGSHEAVAEVAVVGIPDPVLGEIGAAVIVPVAGRPAPELAELRALCRTRLADYKAPDRLVILDQLPLTAMAKVDKRALSARLAAMATPTATTENAKVGS